MPPRDDSPSPSALIRDLRRAGLTHHVIANAAGVSVTTIWRMANEPDRDHFSSSVRRVRELHDRLLHPRDGGLDPGAPNQE